METESRRFASTGRWCRWCRTSCPPPSRIPSLIPPAARSCPPVMWVPRGRGGPRVWPENGRARSAGSRRESSSRSRSPGQAEHFARTCACRWPSPSPNKPRNAHCSAAAARVQVRSTRAMESAVPEKLGPSRRMAGTRSVALVFCWKSRAQAMFKLIISASCWIPQVGVSPTRSRRRSSCGAGG